MYYAVLYNDQCVPIDGAMRKIIIMTGLYTKKYASYNQSWKVKYLVKITNTARLFK